MDERSDTRRRAVDAFHRAEKILGGIQRRAHGKAVEPEQLFDQVAKRLREHVFSLGNSVDPAQAYRAFRGRDAGIAALMRKRGFAGTADSTARQGKPAPPRGVE